MRAITADPGAGDEIVGSGGIRKVRVAGRVEGKSGGYRVMVFYSGSNAPASILALLSKGDRERFSADELRAMRGDDGRDPAAMEARSRSTAGRA